MELSENCNIKSNSNVIFSFREIKILALNKTDNEMHNKSVKMIMNDYKLNLNIYIYSGTC